MLTFDFSSGGGGGQVPLLYPSSVAHARRNVIASPARNYFKVAWPSSVLPIFMFIFSFHCQDSLCLIIVGVENENYMAEHFSHVYI